MAFQIKNRPFEIMPDIQMYFPNCKMPSKLTDGPRRVILFTLVTVSVICFHAIDIKAQIATENQVSDAKPTLEVPSTSVQTTDFLQKLITDSQKNRKERALDPSDPLSQAQLHCSGLADDLAELGKHLRMIASAYARQQRWEDATEIVKTIPGWHESAANAELALEAIKAGKTNLAREYLTQCEKNFVKCVGVNKDKVMLLRARIHHALGDKEAVAELRKQLAPDILVEFLTVTREVEEGYFPTTDTITKRRNDFKLSALLTARWALMLAQQLCSRDKMPEARALVDYAGQITAPPASYSDQRGLLDVARVGRLIGEEKVSSKAMNLYVASISRLDDTLDAKAEMLADAATLLFDWKRKAEAEKILKLAEAGVNKVFIYDAAESHLAIARAWNHLGNQEAMKESLLKAAKVMAAMNHARPRAATAVQMLVFHADLKLALDPEILGLLNQVKGEP